MYALSHLMFTATLQNYVPYFKIDSLFQISAPFLALLTGWSSYPSVSCFCSNLYNFYSFFYSFFFLSQILCSETLGGFFSVIRKFQVLKMSYRDFGRLPIYCLNHICTHSFPSTFHCKCSSHLDFFKK